MTLGVHPGIPATMDPHIASRRVLQCLRPIFLVFLLTSWDSISCSRPLRHVDQNVYDLVGEPF